MNEAIHDYVIGNIYYELRFLDPQFLYPNIHEHVYVGRNIAIEDSDTEDLLYFQPVGNFLKYGSATSNKGEPANIPLRNVVEIRANQTSSMLSPESLGAELLKIQSRHYSKMK